MVPTRYHRGATAAEKAGEASGDREGDEARSDGDRLSGSDVQAGDDARGGRGDRETAAERLPEHQRVKRPATSPR